MNTLQIIGFLTLVLLVPLYRTVISWRNHIRRRQSATAMGWRLSPFNFQTLWQANYMIAGTTINGIVWELTRIKQGNLFYFFWSTDDVPLPYGMLQVLPRQMAVTKTVSPIVREVSYGSREWQAHYVVLTSHRQLVKRYMSTEMELSLLHWPTWPTPGALEKIIWHQDGLTIYGRYQDDWATLNRIALLGIALVENLNENSL